MVVTERAPLTRQRVAQTAVDFIDEHGLEKLSMRKLGLELGVEAMAFYNHVANKDDLLQAAADVLLDEVLAIYEPDVDRPFAEDTLALCQAFREVALRHPEAMGLVYDRPLMSPKGFEFTQACYGVFGKVSADPDTAALAFTVAASMITGYLRHEQTVIVALEMAPIDPTTVPAHLQDAVQLKQACHDQTDTERFDAVMSVLIAGLEAQFAS